MSFFTVKLPEEAKKIENFPKFQRWMKKTNILRSEFYYPEDLETFGAENETGITESQDTIYKQLANRACSGRTGEYW